jgi:hypothetical protein
MVTVCLLCAAIRRPDGTLPDQGAWKQLIATLFYCAGGDVLRPCTGLPLNVRRLISVRSDITRLNFEVLHSLCADFAVIM